MNLKTQLIEPARVLSFLIKHRHALHSPGLFDDQPEGGEIGEREAKTFLDDLEALGPAFIKFGQVLSTRPDLIHPAYARALERMQDTCTPIPFAVVRETVEAELGARLTKLFAEVDEEPIGVASLAQVHRATLRDGREVALKVQRPDMDIDVEHNLEALESLATAAESLSDNARRIGLLDWVGELRRSLVNELDYRQEAENLARFARHLAKEPLLRVPAPVQHLCTRRVLVLEYVEGTKLAAISGVIRTERDIGMLAPALLRGFLDQVFVHGELHADPHPGNMLLTPDNRLAIFDLGMVGHITPVLRDRLLKILVGAVEGRGDDVSRDCLAISEPLESFDEPRFHREIGQTVANYAASSRQGGREGALVMRLVEIATRCGVRTPPELSVLGRALLNLESVCALLDPRFDARRTVEEHLQAMMAERMRRGFSLAALGADLVELQGFVREAPAKLSHALGVIADNRLQLRVTGLEESRLLENLQKIANRISAGLVTAALIVASAMLADSDNPRRIAGVAIAEALFVVAVILGVALIGSALWGDRRRAPRRGSS
ncbi:ABC1 kinase family protein [Pseudomarimonas salicorniae]|uniref:AarF/UbiB family protein n=1 Tax=Pseudomarimonas salicorniae TaxID=2933270 RepID=A0ABT0GER1_9GAMM|nr:AarF/UbiB family protein [Lysobacter sp. CAU 1642]MCK7593021.1 AarF/UbiB family protein [Lysobacter sp. CAU 1642]